MRHSDPDSKIITDTAVSAANVGDATVAEDLIADLLGDTAGAPDEGLETPASGEQVSHPNAPAPSEGRDGAQRRCTRDRLRRQRLRHGGLPVPPRRCGHRIARQTEEPTTTKGLFSKDRFVVDLEGDLVTCPAGVTDSIVGGKDGSRSALRRRLASCPLRPQCTDANGGRNISVGPNEATLAGARSRQRDPEWIADYRATRPKVERKIAHLMRRKHGGRRARVRGRVKVAADFTLLAAAANLARLATLGAHSAPAGWTVAGA